MDAATAVPLDEVVRQDRPGVKITYRGNLSETGSISRLGGQERRRPGIKTRGERERERENAFGARGKEREREKKSEQGSKREKALTGGRMG